MPISSVRLPFVILVPDHPLAYVGDSIVTSFIAFQAYLPVRIVVIVWLVLAPITDLFIASLLVWFLVSRHLTISPISTEVAHHNMVI